jgi:hypothetical protein
MVAALAAAVAGCRDGSSRPQVEGGPRPAKTADDAERGRDALARAPAPDAGKAAPRPAADAGAAQPAPATADAGPAPGGEGPALEAVPLLGGRLVAKLPPGEATESPFALPGKVLGCMEYRTSIATGAVVVTALDLGALTSGDLAADAARELDAWHARSQVSKVPWKIAPFERASPPLDIVKATPGQAVGYLCGPAEADAAYDVPARYFVAQPDGTVQIVDFSYREDMGQDRAGVAAFSETVMSSLAPGSVALAREAGLRVLPNVPVGQDIEITMPADTVVSVSEGTDSIGIELGRLRAMGAKTRPDIVVWTHSCVPEYMDEGRAKRTKATVLGLPVDVLRGQRDGRFFEDVGFNAAAIGECSYVTLLADTEDALTALHATFEAGRLVDACSSSDECDGRPCVDRRCQAAAPSP